MADDFGEATFVMTKSMNAQLLACECEDAPGFFHLYKLKSTKRLANGTVSQYFECRGCVAAITAENAGGKAGRVIVRNNRITTNPNEGHLANCQLTSKQELEVKKISQEARTKCRTDAKRPMTAYREAVNEIARRYPNAEEQAEIENMMPPYKRIRRSLYRQVNHAVLPIPDENNLSIQYTLTFRGRQAFHRDPNDQLAQDRFLLHQDPDMMVFASNVDIDVIHQSEYLIADGTFEMVPKQYAQLYTIHGFKNGEAVPVCHALLRNKQRNTYSQLFAILRNAVVQRHGNLGMIHSILMDFELQAHEAVRAVFQVETLGCLFHFGQCLLRWLQRNGLQMAFRNGIGGLREWIRLIKALALLSPDLIIVIWNSWLRNPPQMPNQVDQRKIAEFAVYFENTWLHGGFPLRMWNHFANIWHHGRRQGMSGPRTTNHAEGWHSKLNHDFGHPHPSLCTFLHWLQSTNHISQVRVGQLENGAEPHQRDERYEQVDQQLSAAKEIFLQARANIPYHLPNAQDVLGHEIEAYLRHISHLLGE